MCFCKNPEKHPEPVIVAKGYIKGRGSVFDTSRRSYYLGIDQIKAFLGSHKSVDATHSKLKELEDLEMTLKKQWGYVKLMVTREKSGSPERIRQCGVSHGTGSGRCLGVFQAIHQREPSRVFRS